MRKFEFKKSYEEINIAGKVYRVDFSDENIKKYQKSFNEFYKKNKEFENIDEENLSVEEQQEILDKVLNIIKEFVETILGQNTFDELYDKSGKSIFNMMELVNYLAEIVGEKGQKLRDENYKKYTQKINQNKNQYHKRQNKKYKKQ